MTNANVLLVEGNDDKHVLWSLLQHHNVPKEFDIKSKDGIDPLLEELDVELDSSVVQRLGIVVDADSDIEARWQSLRNRLLHIGCNDVPLQPSPDGTIFPVTRLTRRVVVGIWLMPDNQQAGMLEHFLQSLLPQNDTLWSRAAQCIQGIPIEERRFPQQHTIKAHMHTWLAWQEEPGKPMGLAITKRYLDAGADSAQRLMAWIRRLFSLE